MKSKLTVFFCLCAISFSSFSQGTFKLNGFGGYAFDDKFDSYYDIDEYYNGKIIGGFQWGVGLEYMPHRNYGIEVSWMRQKTSAPITYQGGAFPTLKSTDFRLSSNYILIGTNRYFPVNNSKIEPYFGLGLGMSIMSLRNPDNDKKTDKSFFAWGAKLGTNVFFTEKVGLKLQFNLLSSVQSVGGGFYFGTGGSGAGLSTYSSIMQASIGGGLVFKLGQANTAGK